MQIFLHNEDSTLALGKQLAQYCPDTLFTIHLEGELGAGKTTLSRGLLAALGHDGKVKSPTYTLVERYDLNNRTIYHFDLYRLTDPEELDYLGLDDYLSGNALSLIEWASQGGNYLPKPDLMITLNYENNGRHVELTALSEQGQQLYQHMQSALALSP